MIVSIDVICVYIWFYFHRYTQNPADFWDWFEEYLEDEEVGDMIWRVLVHFLEFCVLYIN